MLERVMETIWHLTVSGEPALPGEEGFVHCSFTGQLAGTLEAHFGSVDQVTLLRLDPDALGEALRLEWVSVSSCAAGSARGLSPRRSDYSLCLRLSD